MMTLLSLTALLLLSSISAPTEKTEQFHERALQLAASGDLPGAGVWFRKAWEERPSEPSYVHDLVVHYIHNHDYSKALEVIGDYVKRLGPTALAWTLQGELLFEQKQYDPAYQSLESALEISNANYRAHELKGLILSVHRRHGLALEELKTAVEQNPGSAQAHYYCGRLYYRTGNLASAQKELMECLKLAPEYPGAVENLGLVLEALGNRTAAVARYRQAIELDKAGKTTPSELPYVALGALLAKEGGNDEALALFREGLSRNPNSAWANFELGRLHFQKGEAARAETHLVKAAELDKRFSRPHFFLGKIYARSDRQQESKAEFATFQELDKDEDNRQPQMTR
ncbi:MAG: tetratricopeptide repeat protein [Bryobacteraceae bacterium]